MGSVESLAIEVAYALPQDQTIIALEVPRGTRVSEAILRSGILQRFPEIDLSRQAVGVFGQRVSLERLVEAGDRIEIYRALIADPKEARKRRASAAKTAKRS